MSYFDAGHRALLVDPVTANDHVRGPATATVTVVEYGDFASPGCREADALLRTLLLRSSDVRLVFRPHPRSFSTLSTLAAEAAEAAGAQGKFWEMHDLLFEHQPDLSPETLARDTIARLARQLGLDLERFADVQQRAVHRKALHAQELSGWHTHVLSTPTFFINGVRFDDALTGLPEAVMRAAREVASDHMTFREEQIETTTFHRRVSITTGPHRLISDRPAGEHGDDAGPSPDDLLTAALGSCTAMTLKWAADKDRIPLDRATVRISQSRTPGGRLFRVSIQLEGNLTEAQRARLERAAERCPISRTLRGDIEIDTCVTIDRTVDEAGDESFPASDPPSWTSGHER